MTLPRFAALLVLAALLACSSTSGDWYYHWDCHGDSQCLALNSACGSGAGGTCPPSGTADVGPSEADCQSLLDFAAHFYGSAAVDSCDQSPGGATGGGAVTITAFVPPADSPGQNVTINGTNFPAQPTVVLGGVTATVVSASSTQIVFTVPAMADYSGPVTVSGTVSTVNFGVANNLYGVAWTGARFIAVGGAGTVLNSADGVSWSSNPLGTATLASVVWSGSQLVAVGRAGTIYTSPDGLTWTKRTSGTSTDLLGAGWSGAQFVAVGNGGALLTSPDGATWTARTSGTSQFLDGVSGTSSKLVAVGGQGALLTSSDGVTWTSGASGTTNALYGITDSASTFVIAGGNGSGGNLFSSTDEVTWTSRTSPAGDALYGIGSFGAQFVAVGSNGKILFSSDGVSWSARTSPTTNFLDSVAYSGSLYVAAGSAGTIVYSQTGSTWLQASTPGVTAACVPTGSACFARAQCCTNICNCSGRCDTTVVICN